MSPNLFYFSVIALSISACSSNNKYQANGDFDYAKDNVTPELSVPNGLISPKTKPDYDVPSLASENSNAPIGEEMDIRAPALVIPIAAASRTEGDSGRAQVWFDQVIDNQDLTEFIRNAVKSQLASDKVELTATDSSNLVFESDWYKNQKESGWLFKEIEKTEAMRFKYTLETKPHGRSVAINVDLIEYEKVDASGKVTNINSIEKHRAEMTMLNTLIGEVDYQYRMYKHELLQAKAKKINVAMGTNEVNQPALIANMDLDSLWTNIPVFFSENAFTVTDLNESKFIYFVDYLKPKPGFWSNLWGESKPMIDLPDGKYRFEFEALEEKTSIVIFDKNNEALSNQALQAMLPYVEKGLSFDSLF